jgi:hypothetical protein
VAELERGFHADSCGGSYDLGALQGRMGAGHIPLLTLLRGTVLQRETRRNHSGVNRKAAWELVLRRRNRKALSLSITI